MRGMAIQKRSKKMYFILTLMVFIVLILVVTKFVNAAEDMKIKYRAHVAYNGWLDWQSNGKTAGTVGESRRLEAIKIKLDGKVSGDVVYQAFVRGTGWQKEVKNSETAGTEGQSKQMEAIKIHLTGKVAKKYNIKYRVHTKNTGWNEWVSNGAVAGSDTTGLRIEAVEIKLVKKDEPTGNSGESQFTKYDLSDAQLRGLAMLCQREQGTAKGAAAEASLMANHMDLRHGNAKKYKNDADGLYKYVRYGGWFAHAASHMDNQSQLRNDVLVAVKKVLVEGKRTVPGYIVEHDCFSDISSATNEGKAINRKDRSAYVKNKTVIKNRYGAKYTFYCFPTNSSDPFGYMSEDTRAKVGEFCYNFEDI